MPSATATIDSPSDSSTMPKVKRNAPLSTSVPTSPNSMPVTIIAMPLSTEPCASAVEVTRPSRIRAKYSADPNFSATAVSGTATDRDHEGREGAGDERADRRDRERLPGAPLPRHLVAVDRRHRGRHFARQVDQDRRGGAAILRAVIDAGEHDERSDRREVVGERQQHRDRGGRADPRQHADEGADQCADEAVEQVLQRQRGAKSEREVVDQFHRSHGPIAAYGNCRA